MTKSLIKQVLLEELPWDSGFFNKRVARIEIAQGTDKNELLDFLEKYTGFFDLIYVFSKIKYDFLEANCFSDIKLVFSKTIQENRGVSNIERLEPDQYEFERLYDLALTSGEYSRFKRDNRFEEGQFQELYKRWIEKSINSENSIVFVDKELKGFVTLDALDQDMYQIGLIAVDSQYQGQGRAIELVKFAEDYAYRANGKRLQVATQGINERASRFYKQYGFDLIEQVHLYHYWTNDSL